MEGLGSGGRNEVERAPKGIEGFHFQNRKNSAGLENLICLLKIAPQTALGDRFPSPGSSGVGGCGRKMRLGKCSIPGVSVGYEAILYGGARGRKALCAGACGRAQSARLLPPPAGGNGSRFAGAGGGRRQGPGERQMSRAAALPPQTARKI